MGAGFTVAVTVEVGAADMVPVQAACRGQQATLLSGSSAQVDFEGQHREGAPRVEQEVPD